MAKQLIVKNMQKIHCQTIFQIIIFMTIDKGYFLLLLTVNNSDYKDYILFKVLRIQDSRIISPKHYTHLIPQALVTWWKMCA